MKRTVSLLILLAVSISMADPIDFFDWGFNINGNKYLLKSSDPSIPSVDETALPPTIDQSGFNWGSGLGSLTWNLDPGAADHYYIASFFDFEIDQEGTILGWAADKGAVNNYTDSRLSYEIDEPGYTSGDIYDHLLNYDGYASTFDNLVYNDINGANNVVDDGSVGMGWNFDLTADQYATITFNVTTTDPVNGFYLKQWNSETNNAVYFTSNLTIESHTPPPQGVPEPSAFSLILCGLASLSLFFRGIRKRG